MRNIGNRQRLVRAVLAAALLAAVALGAVPNPWGIALAVLGFAILVTAVTGWCPIFPLFGIRTVVQRRDNAPRQ